MDSENVHTQTIQQIELSKIAPNPEQPRTEFDQEKLHSLADSIKENGLIQPIVVEAIGNDKYFIVDGERRFRAHKLLRLETVPAVVVGKKDQATRLFEAILANLQREDLGPIEEARAYQRMRDEFGLSINQIAIKLGKNVVHIKNRLDWIGLDDEILDLVDSGQLHRDSRVADALKKVEDKDTRISLAKRASAGAASIDRIIASVEKLVDLQSQPVIPSDTPPARKYAKPNRVDERKWGALQQNGKVPAWEIISAAADETCDVCALRDTASPMICKECPAVVMLSMINRRVNDHA